MITLPPLSASSVRFWLRPLSVSSTQPWSGKRSIYGPQVQVWIAEISLTDQDEDAAEEIGAIFSRVGGVSSLIRAGNPVRGEPLYNRMNAGATVAFSDGYGFTDGTAFADGLIPAYASVLDAATIEASSIVITGLPPSLSPALFPGDLFELRPNGVPVAHGHLYKVVAKAPTNADGETRVYFTPPLRKAVAAGDQVVLKDPTSVFRAMDDQQGLVDWQPGTIGRTGFTLIEELPG